ncbi:MAG: phosphoribosylglycinamide synthetase C domain-containing protein, partial [Hyphomonas sp.]
LMMRLRDDLANIMWLCATGKLDELDAESPEFEASYALTVIMAANGYPGTPEKGGAIDISACDQTGARDARHLKIFHAGTALKDGALVANGGRVLAVTATGASVTEAQAKAYAAVDVISFPTGFCRRDIGWREVAREGQ